MQIREELEKLVKLQEFDLRVLEAKKTLRVAPFFLKPLEEELRNFDSDLSKFEESKKDLEKRVLDLENAVKSDAIYADSMESKLVNVLDNHKEYHYTAKNIDKLRKLGRDRTTEIAKLNEKLDKINSKIANSLEEKNVVQSQLDLKKAEVEIQIKDAHEEISSIRLERESFLPGIAPLFLSKYERLTTAYGHGVGIVKDKRCTSCDVLVPAQTYNLLQRGEETLHCPNCQRLLHLKAQ